MMFNAVKWQSCSSRALYVGYALILMILGRSDVNLKCDLQHQDLPVGAKERCFSVGNWARLAGNISPQRSPPWPGGNRCWNWVPTWSILELPVPGPGMPNRPRPQAPPRARIESWAICCNTLVRAVEWGTFFDPGGPRCHRLRPRCWGSPAK